MKQIHFGFLIVLAILFIACKPKTSEYLVKVHNPGTASYDDFIVELNLDSIKLYYDIKNLENILVKSEALKAYELKDEDLDGKMDLILVNLNLPANKNVDIWISEGDELKEEFTKRTYAEISHKVDGEWKDRKYLGGTFQNVDRLVVPAEHTDHSEYIRYEGPGWESDKVGYRFYLDWRNATDIFGKRTDTMVLHQVGLDGFDSYHEPQPWGMDILKVGASLGVGSPGIMEQDTARRIAITDSLKTVIIRNGNLESAVQTNYYGWQTHLGKVDVTSELTIRSGDRHTHHKLILSSPLDGLCTGLAKHENTEFISGTDNQWSYLATWGLQSLAGDKLGMAIVYNNASVKTTGEDELNHLVIFKQHDLVEYYFLAA